jgi:hypothetical protein
METTARWLPYRPSHVVSKRPLPTLVTLATGTFSPPAGFTDTEPLLREATVKASLYLAPALNAVNGLMLLRCAGSFQRSFTRTLFF